MIEYTYSPEIAEADRPIILESRIYKEWLENVQKKFIVTKVHFSSVDFLRKGRQPLFIKLRRQEVFVAGEATSLCSWRASVP